MSLHLLSKMYTANFSPNRRRLASENAIWPIYINIFVQKCLPIWAILCTGITCRLQYTFYFGEEALWPAMSFRSLAKNPLKRKLTNLLAFVPEFFCPNRPLEYPSSIFNIPFSFRVLQSFCHRKSVNI